MTAPRHLRGVHAEVLRRAALAIAGAATGLVAAVALRDALAIAGDAAGSSTGHAPALPRVGAESMVDVTVVAARWAVVLCAAYLCALCLLNLVATRSTPRVARLARAITPRMVAAMAAGLLVATAASPSGASAKGASPSGTGDSATESPGSSAVWMYRIGSGDGRGDGSADSSGPDTSDPDVTTPNAGSPSSTVPTTSIPISAVGDAHADAVGTGADDGVDDEESTTTLPAGTGGAGTANTWLPWAEVPPAIDAAPPGAVTDTTTALSLPESASGDAAAAGTGAGGGVATERFYTVEPGDHFWSIAERAVAERSGVDASMLTEREVARYWLELIEVNRHRLVDPDNPDLIHPGLEIELPR